MRKKEGGRKAAQHQHSPSVGGENGEMAENNSWRQASSGAAISRLLSA